MVTSLVGCSNTYVKSTVDGTIVESNQTAMTHLVPRKCGKTTVLIPRTHYSCTYKVKINETVISIKTSGLCRYQTGDIVAVQLIHDEDSDEFIRYRILEE